MRLNWRSRGVATDDAMVSGLAPGSEAWTLMAGKSTWGRGATGSCVKATAPARATAAVQQTLGTGRRMKGRARLMATSTEPARAAVGGPFRHEREVDHHDPVLLHDADQEDDADERDDVELRPADDQGEDRSHAGGGQRREDRQRMDVALVQDPEHDVDDHQRGEDEERLVRQRGVERLGGPLEGG